MALVSMKDMLLKAQREGYGVGNFDVFNTELLKGVMEAQAALSAPVILAYAPPFNKYSPIKHFAKEMISYAEDTELPVVIHLDHANTMEEIEAAIAAGFNSIMIDASSLPFDENVAMVKSVVERCHPLNIPVEAELGHVGDEGDSSVENYGFTDPDLAKRFVESTGIDCLAVAIGNVHGVYKSEPKINYDILTRVRAAVSVPLVLHGASGIPEEDIRKCTKIGITKINIHTDMLLNAIDVLKKDMAEGLDYHTMSAHHTKAVREVAEAKMKLFGSEGRG